MTPDDERDVIEQFEKRLTFQIEHESVEFRGFTPTWQSQLLDKADFMRSLTGLDAESVLKVLVAYQFLLHVVLAEPYAQIPVPYWVVGTMAALSDSVKVASDLSAPPVE